MRRPKAISSVFAVLLITTNSTPAEQPATNRFGTMARSMFDMMDAFSTEYGKRGNDDTRTPGNYPAPTTGNLPFSSTPSPMTGHTPWSMGMSPWGWNSMQWPQGYPDPSRYLPGFGSIPNPGIRPDLRPDLRPGLRPGLHPGLRPGLRPGLHPDAPQRPASITAALDGHWQGKHEERLIVYNGRFRIFRDRSTNREGRIDLQSGSRLTLTDPTTGNAMQYEYAEHRGKLVLRNHQGHLLLFRRAPLPTHRSTLNNRNQANSPPASVTTVKPTLW
ncbi:MAG: hypothetical protein GY703_09855 [Gammaproteobacteria bacterium]|nr:hypothetical protein [Gammaproteobacteria bacterium]